MAKDYDALVKDAYGALDYLAGQPFVDREKIAVMGFSLGAFAINNALIPWRVRTKGGLDFKAAIALYGMCFNIGDYPKGSIPLMEIIGEKDERFAASCLTEAKINPRIKVQILPGAHHSFDSPESSGKEDLYGNYMQYDASATAKAKGITKAFLRNYFGE